MQTVSAEWEAAVRGGSATAVVRCKVEVYSYTGELLASTEEAVDDYPALQLADGKVSVDGSAQIRRSARLTFLDADGVFAPNFSNSVLANESGNEVKVWAGFEYLDGDVELLPQGVFGFASDDTDSPIGSQTVTIQLYDRARRIKRAKFVMPYTIPSGTNYGDAITHLLHSRWADIIVNVVPTIFTTPKLTFDANDDPWEKAQDMAKKIGYELFFDVEGVCQLKPILGVTPNSAVQFDYSEGADSVVLDLSRRASNEQGYNGVIVTGSSSSNTGSPPRGEAWDTDPGSPTYSGYDPQTKWFGPSPYGAVPKFVSSSLVKTNAQAAAAAAAELLNTIGRHEIIEFTAIPNPAHEPRDLVKVKRARAKIDAVYELQSFDVPLRLGTMTALTKERRVA